MMAASGDNTHKCRLAGQATHLLPMVLLLLEGESMELLTTPLF